MLTAVTASILPMGTSPGSLSMQVSTMAWVTTIGVIVALLVLDLATSGRKPHEVTFREASLWSVFYTVVGVAFGAWVWSASGAEFGKEYFAAYVVERSLSVDNLFVFAIILAQFAVPAFYHQRVLLVGVVLALAFRTVFIVAGAAALHAFTASFVVFGGILVWTGIGLLRHWDQDPDPSDNIAVRVVRRMIPVTSEYHGGALFVREGGRRVATPIMLVMVAIGATDVLFALDSIPATFGVTREPFLVFAANAFALLGLRALFFLLQGLLKKLVYLSIALALILIFIGVKLVFVFTHEQFEWGPKISTNLSLGVIGAILAVATVASIIKTRRDPSATAHAGTVRGHAHHDEARDAH